MKCERCGSAPATGDRVPWCGACLDALVAARGQRLVKMRREYRRDYQRAYMRDRRQEAGGTARPKWRVGGAGNPADADGGRMFEVTLRRNAGRVTICGRWSALSAGRRLAFGVLGCDESSARVEGTGGGKGRRWHKRFRIDAAVDAGAFEETMRALEQSGTAARVKSFQQPAPLMPPASSAGSDKAPRQPRVVGGGQKPRAPRARPAVPKTRKPSTAAAVTGAATGSRGKRMRKRSSGR